LKAEDIRRAKAEGKLGIIFYFESANMLEGEIAWVPIFHRLGLRIVQLTYSRATSWGTDAWKGMKGDLPSSVSRLSASATGQGSSSTFPTSGG